MQKEAIRRNHYKTQANLKDTFIFFYGAWIYKTFESDATIIAQLFWFQLKLSDWLTSVSFADNNSRFYFNRLSDAGYSYIALEIWKDWNVSTIQRNIWYKPLELTIPLDTFQSLLKDVLQIYERYSTAMRLIQPIDLIIDEPWTENIKKEDVFLPAVMKDNIS